MKEEINILYSYLYLAYPLYFAFLTIFGLNNENLNNFYAYYWVILNFIFYFYFLKKIFLNDFKFNITAIKKFFAIFLFVSIFLLNLILLNFNEYTMGYYFQLFVSQSLLAFFAGVFMQQSEKYDAFFRSFDLFNLFLTIMIFVNFLQSRGTYHIFNFFAGASHLLIGYTLGTMALYNIFKVLNCKFQIWRLILVFVQLYLLLSSGSRGPFIGFLFLVVLMVVFKYKIKSAVLFLLILLLLLILPNFLGNGVNSLANEVVGGLERITKTFNFSNPNEPIINWETTGGRQQMYLKAIDLIKERPILGYGIGGFEKNSNFGGYPHNMFLEIMVSFGFVGLIVFLLLFFFFLKKGLIILYNNQLTSFIVYLILYELIHLQVSGSFITNYQLWFLIGAFVPFSKSIDKGNNAEEKGTKAEIHRSANNF